MFQRCAEDCEYEQAIGIALESRRLDIVKTIIQKGDADKLLSYVLDVCMTLVQNLEFRNEVLRLLVDLYKTLQNPDYISISQCLVHLNDPASCAVMLKSLVEKKDEVSCLCACRGDNVVDIRVFLSVAYGLSNFF